MQNGHIEININTTISLAAGLGTSQAVAALRAVVSLLKRTNKPLAPPLPHFTKIK